MERKLTRPDDVRFTADNKLDVYWLVKVRTDKQRFRPWIYLEGFKRIRVHVWMKRSQACKYTRPLFKAINELHITSSLDTRALKYSRTLASCERPLDSAINFKVYTQSKEILSMNFHWKTTRIKNIYIIKLAMNLRLQPYLVFLVLNSCAFRGRSVLTSAIQA